MPSNIVHVLTQPQIVHLSDSVGIKGTNIEKFAGVVPGLVRVRIIAAALIDLICPAWWPEYRGTRGVDLLIHEQLGEIQHRTRLNNAECLKAWRMALPNTIVFNAVAGPNTHELVAIVDRTVCKCLKNGRVHYISDWSQASRLVDEHHVNSYSLDRMGSTELYLAATLFERE